jgi:hypothetical protein
VLVIHKQAIFGQPSFEQIEQNNDPRVKEATELQQNVVMNEFK